jgi:hypothetical protein
MLKEQLASGTMNLELHDCDEEFKQEDGEEPPMFSYG